MSTDRILVHASILPAFKSALTSAVSELFPNPSILVTPGGVKKTSSFVHSAVSAGANVIHGTLTPDSSDTSASSSDPSAKFKMAPVILENIQKPMPFYSEEAFGPAVGLMTVNSDAEAIDIMNDTGYGLSASVFTKDLTRGLKVAREIESGAVHLNRMTVHDESNLPHGGVGRSGWGRFNATAGIEEFLKTKQVTWMD